MTDEADDLCPRPEFPPAPENDPLAPPLYPSVVYRCQTPDEAEQLLAGTLPGYVYSRDGHPNADLLADKCRRLHAAERAVVCGSGMSALSIAVLATCVTGDHIVASDQLYGRSLKLLTSELARLGIETTVVDTNDLAATRAALRDRTRLVIVETIANPLLRVADIPALAEIAHARQAALLVDNSFAGPSLCRPLEHGADLVLESITKIMNGHSDVLLGLLCGRAAGWDRVQTALATWGFSASPFDCWLATRGLGTLALRAERASLNALAAAEFLTQQKAVETVHYPGLPEHRDHALARRMLSGGFGSVVTFTLTGGRRAAEQFIAAATQIPFCPSLGDLSTTLTHPETTSHRTISAEARKQLGIGGGTIRLSVGIESVAAIREALVEGLAGVR